MIGIRRLPAILLISSLQAAALLTACSAPLAPPPPPITTEPAAAAEFGDRVNPEMLSRYMKSRLMLRDGDREGAYNQLLAALAIDGENSFLWGDMATVALRLGRTDEAIAAAHRSLKVQPHRLEVNEALAMALEFECQRKGDSGPWEESLTAQQRLVELAPDDFDYRRKLGDTAMHLKRWQIAEPAYETASRLAASSPELLHVRLRLGWLKMQTGNYRKADELFQSILSENPDNWQAMVGIALANRAAGEPEKARTYLERALAIRPDNSEIKGMLFDIYSRQKLLPEAAEIGEKMLQEKPDNLQLQLELGRLYMRMEEFEKAGARFESLVEEEPDDAGYHYYHGSALWSAGLSEQAENEFKRTVTLAPDRVEGWIHLAYVLLDQGKFREAADSLAAAPPEVREHYEVRCLRSTAEFQLGNYPLAIEQGEASLKAKQDYPPAMFYLAAAYERSGRFDKAVKIFRRLIDKYPQDHRSCNYLAYMFAEKGVHLDQSLNLVRRALAVEPDNGVYLDTLGWVYFKLGRLEEAAETLRRAAELKSDPLIYEHLGDVYNRQKQYKKAYEAYLNAWNADNGSNRRLRQKVDELRKSISVP